MGQGASEFASLEAARRGNIANMDIDAMRATFAGINDKETAQRIANQGTLMAAGKVKLEDGTTLNVNNRQHLKDYHAQQLTEAANARKNGDIARYNNAMDKIKAAQEFMAKSDSGRADIRSNYEAAAKSNQIGGLTEAASHLMGTHGSDIKAVNRGMYSLMQDLATADFAADGSTALEGIKERISNHTYDKTGINKYTAQSLASADEAALDRFVSSASSMEAAERAALGRLIDEARSNANIQVQDAIEAKFKEIDQALGRNQSDPNRNRAPGDRRTPGGIIY